MDDDATAAEPMLLLAIRTTATTNITAPKNPPTAMPTMAPIGICAEVDEDPPPDPAELNEGDELGVIEGLLAKPVVGLLMTGWLLFDDWLPEEEGEEEVPPPEGTGPPDGAVPTPLFGLVEGELEPPLLFVALPWGRGGDDC